MPKTANVLDKLPKRLQARAKEKLYPIWMADTREHANQAFDQSLETYQAKYSKATHCLQKDREEPRELLGRCRADLGKHAGEVSLQDDRMTFAAGD